MPVSRGLKVLAAKARRNSPAQHSHRVYDGRYDTNLVRVLPGDLYLTDAADETIVTVLGSCIAACVRNPHSGFGGLNHFLLPSGTSSELVGDDLGLRFGNFAMEALISEVLKSGCAKNELEIKLFGGADLRDSTAHVGSKNAEFAVNYLRSEGLEPIVADLGGSHGRRIHYSPATGRAQRLLLQRHIELRVALDEVTFASKLVNCLPQGAIERFDECSKARTGNLAGHL